jgi:hypothetical protein
MNLYQITEEIERINDMLERTEGDESKMTDEDRQAMQMFVEGMMTEAHIKADGYARSIREIESRAKARRIESRELADAAASEERRAERVKRFILMCMERIGERQLVGMTWTLAVQRNGGARPVEVFGDPEQLPARFVTTTVTVTPNKDALRKALEQNDPDAQAFAELKDRGVSLRIR